MKDELNLSGHIVDVVTGRIFPGIVAIREGKIHSITATDSAPDQYIMPGFIDAHVHVESSMLIPYEFARLAVVHGSVATVSDPHEIANVNGLEGVKYMIEDGKRSPFKFYFGAPSCVPATAFETAGAVIDSAGIRELMAMDEIRYLAEMMNFPGVLHKDPEVMKKIAIAHEAGKVVDGHAPGLRGELAKQYIDAGISTDHECFTREEALDKLKYGMKILIREGSAAKNFEALIDLLPEYPDRIMFCSDDKHPNDLVVGHLNLLAQRAVARGIDPMTVIRATSLNVVKHYGLEVGLVQTGDPADLIVVEDLASFKVKSTYIEGKLVAEKGKSLLPAQPGTVINHFNSNKIDAESLKVPRKGDQLRVIEVEDGQLITKQIFVDLGAPSDFVEANVEQDILKIVVVNRHQQAPPAVAFVKNFGFSAGAIASSVAHDSHNIVAVGTNDEDLAGAINQVIEAEGGVSLCDGDHQDLLPLEVGGLMTVQDGYAVAEAYSALDAKAKAMGSTLASPYMTLSFCALLVIPRLKLSDLGLFDGDTFEFVTLFR